MSNGFRHLVLDDFLPEDLHSALLEYAFEKESEFVPSSVLTYQNIGAPQAERRVSLMLPSGLGPHKKPFKETLKARFQEVAAALGMDNFERSGIELELAAHRDGAFFCTHIDTMTGDQRRDRPSERMVSMVYYFHNRPQRFTGGELALYPLGKGEPILIEPRDNRLLAFPSFAIHEVRPVRCEPDDFRNARFAINCWAHRLRPGHAASTAAPATS